MSKLFLWTFFVQTSKTTVLLSVQDDTQTLFWMIDMRYSDVMTGIFIERPNRFIAIVSVNGKNEVCHVKNTGRCKEILIKGVTVVLQRSDNPDRKTKYDVIAVYKGKRLINIDSQVPNAVVEECLPKLNIVKNLKTVVREVKYGNSRFDIYAEGNRKCFIEVKGVTLEDDGVVLFPDAPTERGVKHVNELMKAMDEGYDACIFLVIQMSGVKYFTPNYETHREFGEILKKAWDHGVKIIAYDCIVTENSIDINKEVEVRL